MRTLPPSAFAGDDGAPDRELRETLAAQDGTQARYLAAVVQLCLARLLAPILAIPADPAAASAKQSTMALAILNSSQGEAALPVFTGIDTLTKWNSQARPVPVTLDTAAKAARAEPDRQVSLVVDPGEPWTLTIDPELLDHFAAGQRLTQTADGKFGFLVPPM